MQNQGNCFSTILTPAELEFLGTLTDVIQAAHNRGPPSIPVLSKCNVYDLPTSHLQDGARTAQIVAVCNEDRPTMHGSNEEVKFPEETKPDNNMIAVYWAPAQHPSTTGRIVRIELNDKRVQPWQVGTIMKRSILTSRLEFSDEQSIALLSSGKGQFSNVGSSAGFPQLCGLYEPALWGKGNNAVIVEMSEFRPLMPSDLLPEDVNEQ